MDVDYFMLRYSSLAGERYVLEKQMEELAKVFRIEVTQGRWY